VTSIPGTGFKAEEAQSCASCENSENCAFENASKVKHFGIKGDICVTEDTWFVESGKAKECSKGFAAKKVKFMENCENNTNAEEKCYNLTFCPGKVTSFPKPHCPCPHPCETGNCI
jgi:hypothetical protein